MAQGDCQKCGGWGRCQRCQNNDSGLLRDGSDCECTYGETHTLGQCIYCAGTGDSQNGMDLSFIRTTLKEKGRTAAVAGIAGETLPSAQGVDWDKMFGG